jgi:predicted TIM-barrel fold metal-dependent hydrolase
MNGDAVIDACVHHAWPNQPELMEYMSSGWREFLGRPGLLPNGGGMIPIAAGNPYQRPGGEARLDARPASGHAAGSDYELLKTQLLDGENIGHAVLSFDAGAQCMSLANPYATMEIARAANEWTIERWLGLGDTRLSSLMLVPNQIPTEAAAEIRRVGRHPGIVGALLGGNGLGRAFGHPAYHPIYEAAAEMDLPIVIKIGSEVVPDTPSSTAAGGNPATYAEYRALAAQPMIMHVTSMITQGVFVKYPTLRLFLAGSGAVWITAFLWRFDGDHRAFRREVPWVSERPSVYFRRNVRVGTNPFAIAPSTARLLQALRSIDGIEEMLCFASGYPNADWESAGDIAAMLPEAWRRRVMHDNAAALFRGSVPLHPPVATADMHVGRL